MRLLVVYTSIFFLTSCHTTKLTERRLSEHIGSPNYLHDTKIIPSTKKDTVFIQLNNIAFNKKTKVNKVKSLFLPFIVFNYRRIYLDVILGQSSMNYPYKDFFLTSITAEAERTGVYVATQREPDNNQYTLDISVDSCYTKALYRRTTTVTIPIFSFILTKAEKAYKSETILIVTAKLKKGNSILLDKSYSIKRTQQLFPSEMFKYEQFYSNTGLLDRERLVLSRNLTESLSMSTKECIEKITWDINTVYKSQ